jgi:hypothetical protein
MDQDRFEGITRRRRATYYSPAAEDAVYDRYRWVFHQGFNGRFRWASQ